MFQIWICCCVHLSFLALSKPYICWVAGSVHFRHTHLNESAFTRRNLVHFNRPLQIFVDGQDYHVPMRSAQPSALISLHRFQAYILGSLFYGHPFWGAIFSRANKKILSMPILLRGKYPCTQKKRSRQCPYILCHGHKAPYDHKNTTPISGAS